MCRTYTEILLRDCISVNVLHIKDISEKILYIKEREISPKRFVAQRVREGVLDEE